MSNEPTLTIAGNNDLASDTSRHAISSGMGDPVYLWRSTEDPLVGRSPVVVLADPDERAGFARVAVEAGSPVVSLPIAQADEWLEQAIRSGMLKFISRLHGLPTMARLANDCRAGIYGRRYGVFAAHRLPRNHADDLDVALAELIVYVTSLIDSSLVRVSATTSALGGPATAGWFIIARFEDETIATVEVSAVLPDADDPNGDLHVEVTGSEAVLRAEPERQSVEIVTANGVDRQAWYAEPAGFVLDYALRAFGSGDSIQQCNLPRLMRFLEDAAASDNAVSLS